MGRIQSGYELKFRALLAQVNARRPEAGVEHLVRAAQHRQRCQHEGWAGALAEVCRQTRGKIQRWRRRTGRWPPAGAPLGSPAARFFCDAGLGGLARWLRAAGYDADWELGIDDDRLLAEARRLQAVLVTTDSMLMERRVIRDQVIPAVWVPPALSVQEQLGLVLEELNLPLGQPRCMACGGALEVVDKQTVRDRVPPRTYRWLDEYFRCARCGRVFWHGTHWERIRASLQKMPK